MAKNIYSALIASFGQFECTENCKIKNLPFINDIGEFLEVYVEKVVRDTEDYLRETIAFEEEEEYNSDEELDDVVIFEEGLTLNNEIIIVNETDSPQSQNGYDERKEIDLPVPDDESEPDEMKEDKRKEDEYGPSPIEQKVKQYIDAAEKAK